MFADMQKDYASGPGGLPIVLGSETVSAELVILAVCRKRSWLIDRLISCKPIGRTRANQRSKAAVKELNDPARTFANRRSRP